MSIRYKCKKCGTALKIKDELAGTDGKCPKCKTEFTIPKVDEPAPAVEPDPEAIIESVLLGPDQPPIPDDDDSPFADDDDFLTDDDAAPALPSFPTPTATFDEPEESGGTASLFEDFEPSTETADVPIRQTRTPKIRSSVSASGNAAELLQKSAESRSGSREETKEAAGDGYSLREVVTGLYEQYGLALIGFAVAFMFALWLGLSILGGSDLPPLGKVYGVVTLNGAPLPNAQVTFEPFFKPGAPEEDKPKGTSSDGITNSKGEYELFYLKGYKGAIYGKHTVRIATGPLSGFETIPSRYNAESTLDREVKSGSEEMNFELLGPGT